MIRRCAWCQKNMGRAAPLEDEGVTHGICLPCSQSVLRAAGKDLALASAGSRRCIPVRPTENGRRKERER